MPDRWARTAASSWPMKPAPPVINMEGMLLGLFEVGDYYYDGKEMQWGM